MTSSRVIVCSVFLSGILLWVPTRGVGQTATPWTNAQCQARMDQLFRMAGDPSIDMSEVMGDIGDRAGSSFAIYCRMKESKSIQQLKARLENIEADRKETAGAADRTDKFGKKMENFNRQNPSYDSGFIFGRGFY